MKYIIIVGCGNVGKQLALELSNTENVVMLDKDIGALNSLGDDFNGKKIWGDSLDMETLEKAGVKDSNAVLLLTENDNLNLVVGKVIKRKYGIKNVIVQVNDTMKKKLFEEEGLAVVNRTSLIVDVLRKNIAI